MRNARGLIIFSGILLALDIYIFQVLRYFSSSLQPKTRFALFIGFWAISILSIAIVFLLPTLYFNPKYKVFISYAFALVIGMFFFKLIAVAFFLMDDIRRLFTWIFEKLMPNKKVGNGATNITRSSFLSWLGVGIGGTLFSSLAFGFGNKYNYQIKKIKLNFANLPNAFKGLRIVQLSDIHSGSFDNKAAVEKGINKVLEQQPDIILFTGDLVNNIASEMDNYTDVFAKLKAPMGVYSILGNHDYGDYYQWKDRDDSHLEKEKIARQEYQNTLLQDKTITEDTVTNLVRHYRLYSPMQQKHMDDLKALQKNMGWNLMMNEHVILEKGDDKIALIGIENWGARGNFPRYGRLDLAHKGTENIPFKILMSHDPSHWDAQITKNYSDIDLTLSGHTHGMQFGVEVPFMRWSPVQYLYKQWAGIYEKANQKLYVNRGFGFLGYPGRVGIMPEITVIELS